MAYAAPMAADGDDRFADQPQAYQPAPSNAANYGDMKWWDLRYQKELEPFEWYQPYAELKPLFDQLTDEVEDRSQVNVLNVGCGNSRFTEDMYYDGYRLIKSM